MLMVIFGAGASYDSVRPSNIMDSSYRPPLTADLFEAKRVFVEVANKWRQCASLIDQLRRAAGSGFSIEAQMEQFRALSLEHPRYKGFLIALQFYLREVSWLCTEVWMQSNGATTNYAVLLDYLHQWINNSGSYEPISLVTFNYDTILDASCTSLFGLRINEIDGYVQHPDVHLFKPHGSANWFRDVELGTGYIASNDAFVAELVRHAPEVVHDNFYVRAARTPDLVLESTTGRGLTPAIAIPVQTKAASDFAYPKIHHDLLGQSLSNIRHLLVIGWAGAEQHFMEVLAREGQRLSLETLTIVTESEVASVETLKRMKGVLINPTLVSLVGGGFSGLVERGASSVFDLLNGVGAREFKEYARDLDLFTQKRL